MHARPVFALLFLGLVSNLALGQTAGMLDFQGLIKDAGGNPITGSVDLEFRIFDAEVGGSQVDMNGDGVVDDVMDTVRVSGGAAGAAPKAVDLPDDYLIQKGAKQEGPLGPAVLWLDEATRARGRAATGGSAEALIFHQPHDSGFGFFEKSYETNGVPMWATRMAFGNGWQPGDSISSYELKIFHSTSDDIGFGTADYAVELWDGDPFSIMETVCATLGVSAPIPGTQGIIADVPFGTVVIGRVELPAKVAYGCDRVWMGMTSLTGCRAAWRISGNPGFSFSKAPDVGSGNGLWLFTGCESSTFSACPTDTGLGVGFCCGSQGTCSVSGAPCGNHWNSQCPAGETCVGGEPCDHGSATNPVLCSSTAVATATFCGDGVADYYIADIGLPDTERGYVGSIFAATNVTMFIVPVSVDAPPSVGGSAAGVISLGGDEVILEGGDHNVWLEVMIGDWSPDTLAGYQPALDMTTAISSGLQGTLSRYTGGISCGECSDNLAPCLSHADCTVGTCSVALTPCHLTVECPSGETCDGSATCAPTATGTADCEAVLGAGTLCGPAGYGLGTGTCSWAYTDNTDPRWALRDAGATFPALDVTSIDARPSYGVVFGPPLAPVPFPAEGMYAATLAVHVPADARGTFTIGLKPFPASSLFSGAGSPIPLLGVVPAKITVQVGRCCFTTGGEVGCLDGNQTVGSCAALPGVTQFTANESCPENGGPPCVACLPEEPSTYDDGDACTDDACIDGVPTHTPRVCNDGLFCTDDDCDPADPTDIGCFYTPVDIDDGLDCTIDSCDETNDIVVNAPVDVDDGMPCTFDTCSEGTAPDPCTNPLVGPGSAQICHEDLSVVPNPYPCSVAGDPRKSGCPGADGNPELISTACTDDGTGTEYCHCLECFELICPVNVRAGKDCYQMECGASEFSFHGDPIPADFFGPGSAPFDGTIRLSGSGTGDPDYDFTIERLENLVFDGVLPSQQTVDIELVSLNLISCEPIDIQMPDGVIDPWNVKIGLSGSVTPPTGTLTATKQHANGGVFIQTYFVQPTLVFIRVADPNDIRTFDTGQRGIDPFQIESFEPEPWVHEADDITVSPCGVGFVPGVEEEQFSGRFARSQVPGRKCCVRVKGGKKGKTLKGKAWDCSACPRGACCGTADGEMCKIVTQTSPGPTAKQLCERSVDNGGEGGTYMNDFTNCSDSDNDGIADVRESDFGNCAALNPCRTGTSPKTADSDGDGCLDGEELAAGTDACDPSDPPGGCPGFTDNNDNGIADALDLLNGLDCDGNGEIDPPSPGTVKCDDSFGQPEGVGREDCKGACCHGLTACVESTKDWCESRVTDARGSWSFRGLCTKCPTTGGSTSDHQGLIIRHFPESGPALDVCVDAGLSRGAGCIVGDLIDAWKTDPTQEMCHQFGVDTCPADCHSHCSPPIPADFFGPGSDPFVGEVCLEGMPLGGQFGEADTLIRRSADPFDRCDLPSALEVTVDAEIIELSLQSKEPIWVAFNGETDCTANPQNCEQWDVVVGLSDTVIPPMGQVSAIKTHCNGGTYSSVLHVQPKFTFTRVGGEGVGVLDTGTEGICHVTLIQGQGPEPDSWLSDLDPGVATLSPYCTDFHPAFTTDAQECHEGTAPPDCDCDCNGGDVRDKCDIESGLSQDCNENAIPDECELLGNDCNGNGIPDECEDDCNRNGVPDSCDVDPTDPDGNGLVSVDCDANGIPDECEDDCNANGIADACDIAAGTSQDVNANGTPDECEPDCQPNGVPDGWDLSTGTALDCQPNSRPDACDVTSGISADCNANDVPDECDLAAGTLTDIDANGIPDVCDCTASPLAEAEMIGQDISTKNRFLSFSTGIPNLTQAIRVTLMALPPPFDLWNGAELWVGPTSQVSEAGADVVPTEGFPNFTAATLQCAPFYTDWSLLGTIHVFHEGIVPDGDYQVDVIDEGCNAGVASNFSAALPMTTAIWGDTVLNLADTPPLPPEGTVNVVDALGVLGAFSSAPGAIVKARADLEPACLDLKINVTDVLSSLSGFVGLSYPFNPTATDPCNSTCLNVLP